MIQLEYYPREPQLDKRLAAIATRVRPNAPLFDIGSDHAKLPAYLLRHGHRGEITISDVREKPLLTAKARLGEGNAAFVLSNGFENLRFVSGADIIIAGMGGETIADIILGCPFLQSFTDNERFLLQPMTQQHIMLSRLAECGFMVTDTEEVAVRDKHYTIYLMMKGATE
ncbi:MAG: class I SAM-dependent methyltransferase [Oscillospiraceae bacterium]|nr:class I SAM-dependent methyltransferase [Oscillospiraceae bacterium]